MSEEHEHDYNIHYTAVDWQNPIFIKCHLDGCGSTYYLARKPVFIAAERLANAAEDILHTVYTAEDWKKLADAWQAYVDVAPEEDPTDVDAGHPRDSEDV